MKSATDSNRPARRMGGKLQYLTHGGLLACGLFLAVQHSVLVSGRTSMPFDAIAGNAAQARNLPFVGPPAPAPGERAVVSSTLPDHVSVAALLDMAGQAETVDYTSAFEAKEAVLSEEMQRVRDWVSRKYGVSGDTLDPVLAQTEYCARDAGLDPLLIVAVMAVESSFNPMAESHMGAQGLMQVIPRWHKDKLGENAGENALFDPLLNVQVGTQVLVEGLQRFGTLQAALQYYGGARNDPQARYSKKVLAMKQQLTSVSRVDEEDA